MQSQLATKANADDVTALGGDVNGVKSDLATTNNNLQMARGELGTLIAKNHDQIDELRRMGERDYFEFTSAGKGNKSKAGSLMIELRGTNIKKNQFTVDLYVDDMRLEKKNRSVDEPIYFYTQGTRVSPRTGCEPGRQGQSGRLRERPEGAAHGTSSASSKRDRRVNLERDSQVPPRSARGSHRRAGPSALPVFFRRRATSAQRERFHYDDPSYMIHTAGHFCPPRIYAPPGNRRSLSSSWTATKIVAVGRATRSRYRQARPGGKQTASRSCPALWMYTFTAPAATM